MNNKFLRRRKSLRLREFDYAQPGAYFITICTHKRLPILCHTDNDLIRLNILGQIAQAAWTLISRDSQNVQVDQYVIMPNHIHGIIILSENHDSLKSQKMEDCVGAGFPGPTEGRIESLCQIIARFKYRSTKEINVIRQTTGQKVWQRSYYEHVIRDEEDLRICREYIINNPRKWQLDKYYCQR